MNDVMPLFDLGLRLRRIPALGAVLQLFEDGKDMVRFYALVSEYLPEHKDEIAGNYYTRDKVASFMQFFSEKYFPLYDGYIDTVYENGDESLLSSLLSNIPMDMMWGFSDDMWHQFEDMRVCDRLLLTLMRSPYEVPDDFSCPGLTPRSSGGERIPILESASAMVGEATVKLIPEKGWHLQVIRKKLEGTQYAPVCDFLSWVAHDTDNGWLDTNPEDEGYMEPLEWDKDFVAEVASMYREAKGFWEKYNEFAAWFEAEPVARFTELVLLMQKGSKERVRVKVHA